GRGGVVERRYVRWCTGFEKVVPGVIIGTILLARPTAAEPVGAIRPLLLRFATHEQPFAVEFSIAQGAELVGAVHIARVCLQRGEERRLERVGERPGRPVVEIVTVESNAEWRSENIGVTEIEVRKGAADLSASESGRENAGNVAGRVAVTAARKRITAQRAWLEQIGLPDFVTVHERPLSLAPRVRAVAEGKTPVLAIFERRHDVAAIECLPGGHRAGHGLARTDQRVVGIAVERDAVDLSVGDDVDNAGDSVRSVDRR